MILHTSGIAKQQRINISLLWSLTLYVGFSFSVHLNDFGNK